MDAIHASFAKMGFLKLLGASLIRIEKGEVEIVCNNHDALTQQHGFVHAGVITTLVDTACGYAAQTMMSEGFGVLTVEFKSNFIAPAKGEKFIAIGKVIKAGKTLTLTQGEVYAVEKGQKKLISMMQATMMAVKIEEAQ